MSDPVSDVAYLEERGIFLAPYSRDGAQVMMAIDSRGRLLASISLHRGLTPSRVRRILAEILEAVEPACALRPGPRLVRDVPREQPLAPAATMDAGALVRLFRPALGTDLERLTSPD